MLGRFAILGRIPDATKSCSAFTRNITSSFTQNHGLIFEGNPTSSMYGVFTYMYPVNYQSHPHSPIAQRIVGCTPTKVTSMGNPYIVGIYGLYSPRISREHQLNTRGTLLTVHPIVPWKALWAGVQTSTIKPTQIPKDISTAPTKAWITSRSQRLVFWVNY